MFGRLLWKLLRSNRGRLAVALVAVTSGATVISALLNLQFDIERKLTQEFRLLGANIVISPRDALQSANAATPPRLMNQQAIVAGLQQNLSPSVVAEAPYLYVVARVAETPVVVAGTWLDQTPKLDPTWRIEGSWIASREDRAQCLVGRRAARQFALGPGSEFQLNYLGRNARLRVAGVIDAGGAEDNQFFANLAAVQDLAGLKGQIELVQLSVRGTAAGVGDFATRLAGSLPGFDVRPIRQVTEAEGNLLDHTRLLILLMVLLILVLTAFCVLATMAALAMERRADVGLMKALGGTISRIVGLFLAEVGALGAAGGLAGCVAGFALARWMGRRVFGTAITPRWEILPLTIAMMVAVSMAGALPLRRLGRVKPAVILRGE
ncbi:MAG TPA: ABC transporter permease [Candidatus Acidoferrales bacterium]|nr:ABC transporter permease [Candidatus Acidoferrales bacterium]